MLGKKARQHNTTERQSNTTQHNSPKTVIFKEKTASGGIRTHDCALARRMLLLPRQLSWLGSNHIYNTKQPKHLNQSIRNQMHW